VIDYAYGCQINPNLALAQINRESGFNPGAVGSSGERGLAQFMPGTWQRFAPQGIGFDQAFDVDYNLSAWCSYMAYLSGLFSGDMRKVLIAYNGGEGHLLDPGRYGAPSSAAIGYADSILAASGDWPSGDASTSTDGGAPPPPQSDSSTTTLILIGLGLVVALFAFRR